MVNGAAEWEFSVGASQLLNLRDMLQRWTSAVLPLADARCLNLSVSVDPALPERVYSEPEALNYIVAELMISAIRHTPNAEIDLSLKRRGNALAIIIRDTGIGMPSNPAASRQTGRAATRVPDIGALATPGLSTVRRLTQLMGGSVMIFSQAGEGMTVTVLLPLVSASDAPTQPLRP